MLVFFVVYLCAYQWIVRHPRLSWSETVLWFFYASFLMLVFGVGTYAVIYWDLRAISPATDNPNDYLYFSIVTFTTLGYGDFTPTEEFRILAASQALFGYVYLGSFAGLLVALFSADRSA
ncbi:MAG: hypothetical protein Cons2KO_33550 [Congregibacter sp.]